MSETTARDGRGEGWREESNVERESSKFEQWRRGGVNSRWKRGGREEDETRGSHEV